MNYKKLLLNICIGILTCLCLIIGSSANSFEKVAMQTAIQHQKEAEIVLRSQANRSLIAQAETKPTRYFAILSGNDIVPSSVSTSATGAVGAALIENRLVFRGRFSNLSSPIRDYTTDPLVPPNPNITSGVHVHRGAPSENGPFQYALTINSEANGLGGNLKGEYTLTAEQLQSLNTGNLYIDLHTKTFRAGELRGILKADK
jgi:hypothetical protein